MVVGASGFKDEKFLCTDNFSSYLVVVVVVVVWGSSGTKGAFFSRQENAWFYNKKDRLIHIGIHSPDRKIHGSLTKKDKQSVRWLSVLYTEHQNRGGGHLSNSAR